MPSTLERVDVDISNMAAFEWAKPCESPVGCDDEAWAAVWFAHHRVHDCGSTTFRCKSHVDFLVADAKRVMAMIESDGWRCSGCGDTTFNPKTLDDYMRVIPL